VLTDQSNRVISRKLMGLGALLFLLGLLSGLIIPALTNPRMGLSSHLEGVMNGMFLILIGLSWNHLFLTTKIKTLTFWCLIYGSFANWFFVLLSAIFGTSEMTPIAGAGYKGLPWQESLVNIGLISIGLSMIIAGFFLVVGFMRKPVSNNN